MLKNHGTEIWAVALSADGAYLAGTGIDGKISVWDLGAEGMPKIREYETKGSFGMCVDLVSLLFSLLDHYERNPKTVC